MTRLEQDTLLGHRYRLFAPIASGGMGTVWRAEDTVLHRSVAVKVLSEGLAADDRFVERFRLEARAAAGLSHPNVAGVFDYGEDDRTQTPFIVMELLDGETLADRLHRTGPLPAEEAARIAALAADALETAHASGVVHRDVKPGNIMLTARGDVKVMDFGIAAAAWATPLTATGTTMGTATYISPEQASGDRSTPASDVYSLGVVLFEMLTGRPPFVAGSPVAVASAHVHQAPPSLVTMRPDLPASLVRAVEQALAKDPADRPASAAAFAAMLRGQDQAQATAVLPVTNGLPTPPSEDAAPTTAFAPVAPMAPTPPAPVPAPAAVRRRRRGSVLLAALIAGMLILGLIILWSSRNSKLAPITPPPTPTARIAVPDLAGLTLPDAVQRLTSNGLRLDAVRATAGSPVGTVVRTDPASGASVTPGTRVTLFLAAPPPTTAAPPPPEHHKNKHHKEKH
jgi:serine/threonine-protein kinase